MYPLDLEEDGRLRVLRDLAVVGTPPEHEFDAVCRTAQAMFGTPIALISLVEEDRQWFKAKCGIEVDGTSRDVSFCAHAIMGAEVFVVEDAREDARFANNPLVVGPPGIRFYAGAPLAVAPGVRVGTLCLIDRTPRTFSAHERQRLTDLADIVSAQLWARRDRALAQAEIDARRRSEELASAKHTQLVHTETLLRDIIETIPDAVAAYDCDDRLVLFNSAYKQFYSRSAPAIMIGATFEELVRYGLERGQYVDAGTTPEEREDWLRERLAAHRKDRNDRLVQRLDDGRWLQVTERRSDSGILVGVRTDITDIKHAEMDVRRAAETDPLTGLANREVLWQRLGSALSGRRVADSRGALVLLDIDHFKAINDTHGHDAGDHLLKTMAERLKGIVRSTDVVARLGGDEFAILLLTGLDDVGVVDRIVRKIHQRLVEPIMLGAKSIHPGASIGVAVYPCDGSSPEDLFKSADVALYKTKQCGRNGWNFFDPNVRAQVERRLGIAERLREAIIERSIDVALQQQIRISDMKHVGFEALARWTLDGDPVSPAEFIDIAEEAGLALQIGAVILERAIALHTSLSSRGHDAGCLSVNVGPTQLLDTEFPERVRDVLWRYGLDATKLDLEITENVLFERGVDRIAETLDRLHRMGVGLALDDFGTGYASLAHLKRFPVTKLKIDRSFVWDLEADAGDAAIVQTIVGLARSLKIGVVAEGVETTAQLAFLRQAGCDSAQGYLIARPTLDIGELHSQVVRPAPQLQRSVRYYRGAQIA